MADVNLTPYDVRAAQIAQQQKLAQLLAQQGQQPIEVGSYKGIQAPISPLTGLSKVLQSALSAYQMKKGATDLGQLNQDERDDYLKTLGMGTQSPPASTPPAPQIGPGPSVPPQMAQPAPIAAPAGPDPTAPGNGPAIASALQGPQTPPPPQAQPMPTLPPQAAAPPVAAPPQDVAPPPPDPIQARLAEAKANLQQAQIAAAHFAGTPYAIPATARVTAAQEQLKKIGDLQDAAAEKEADRIKSTARAQHFIAAAPGLDDATRKALTLGAEADPDTAKTVVAAMVKDAFTHKLVPASPVDLQGYPQGTIAQKDPISGKLENIYNPVPNLMAIANEKLHAQEVGLSGARLNLERQRFAFDKDQKNNALLTPEATKFAAEQLLSGDPSPLQNMGRGNQGAQNVVAVRNEMYRQAAAKGISPSQLASINAQFFGQKAEARAAGTRVGATDVATSEIPPLADEAKYRHDALKAQGNLVPLNKAIQMVQKGTSSPELARAVAVNTAVTNAYGRSFGTGVLADNARREAAAQLETAWGTPAYDAALDQIVRNTQIERHGAKSALDSQGRPSPLPAAPRAPHAPYADPAKEARYQAWLKSHGG